MSVFSKSIALDDRTFKNYYIFSEYKNLPDTHPLKPYLKYFATNAADSTETEKIHTKVEWYRTDSTTQERYMTWEQEIQIAAQEAAEAAAEKAAKAATEKERDRNKKIIAEKDETIAAQARRIAELEAKQAEKSK